jgi:hypothetical protein
MVGMMLAQRSVLDFSRLITPVENLQIWHANFSGLSFVISYESRNGPGLHGRPGYMASWRPLHQNRPAFRITGSPFNSFTDAQQACETMLELLTQEL